jgi:hypothetical protein
MEHGLIESLGTNGYFLLGTLLFGIMAFMLFRVAMSHEKSD